MYEDYEQILARVTSLSVKHDLTVFDKEQLRELKPVMNALGDSPERPGLWAIPYDWETRMEPISVRFLGTEGDGMAWVLNNNTEEREQVEVERLAGTRELALAKVRELRAAEAARDTEELLRILDQAAEERNRLRRPWAERHGRK